MAPFSNNLKNLEFSLSFYGKERNTGIIEGIGDEKG